MTRNLPFFKKWVARLKSGQDQQIGRQLKYDKAFCCLGVACDVIDPNGWDSYKFVGGHSFIPEEHADFMGLSREEQEYLSGLNDEKEYTFPMIAAVIEEKLLEGVDLSNVVVER